MIVSVEADKYTWCPRDCGVIEEEVLVGLKNESKIKYLYILELCF